MAARIEELVGEAGASTGAVRPTRTGDRGLCSGTPAHPRRRVAEAASDLFGVKISTGAVDAIYAEAGRRLGGFITALVALLRSVPVIHADETTEGIGTLNCWMRVVSTARYTLIHASVTRGWEAVKEAGVLLGYRGVVIHDRLALYWNLETAKHGICGAHLLRDLASVAAISSQVAWASGLAGLLVTKASVDSATYTPMDRRFGSRNMPMRIRGALASRSSAATTLWRRSSRLLTPALPIRSCFTFFHTHSSGLSCGEYAGKKNKRRRPLVDSTHSLVFFAR